MSKTKEFLKRRVNIPVTTKPYDPSEGYSMGLKMWEDIPQLFDGWVSDDGSQKAHVNNEGRLIIQFQLPSGKVQVIALNKIKQED